MPGAVIKSGALIEYSIIGPNAIIGENAHIGIDQKPPKENEDWNITIVGPKAKINAKERILGEATAD